MSKKRSFQRADRLSKQLLQVLSEALLTQVRDPRVSSVQVTAVNITSDLSYARVFYILMDATHPTEEVQRSLERAAGFLRSHVGQELRLRHIPELVFSYDESIERGRRMEQLLAGLHPHEEE